MANFKLLFLDETDNNDIQVFNTSLNKIYIAINNDDIGDNKTNCACIALDVQTAVKFSKELRRQIAEAKGMSNDKDLI